jgi:hypothetical protein
LSGALPGARLAACPSSASPRTQLSYNCTHSLAATTSEPLSGALPGTRLAACPSSVLPRTQLSYNCTHGLSANRLSPCPALSPRRSIRCRYGRPRARPQRYHLGRCRTGLLWAHHSKSKALGGQIPGNCWPTPGFREGAQSASLPA